MHAHCLLKWNPHGTLDWNRLRCCALYPATRIPEVRHDWRPSQRCLYILQRNNKVAIRGIQQSQIRLSRRSGIIWSWRYPCQSRGARSNRTGTFNLCLVGVRCVMKDIERHLVWADRRRKQQHSYITESHQRCRCQALLRSDNHRAQKRKAWALLIPESR